MFEDKIIEGFSFLRLDTNIVKKFDRLIIHQNIRFIRSRGISRQRIFWRKKKEGKFDRLILISR